MRENLRDIAERAGWTAVETMIAQLALAGAGWVDIGVLKAAAVSGVAAGVSVLKTGLMQRRAA